MSKERFDNVWEALEDDPETVQRLTIQSHLVLAIEKRIIEWGCTQAEASKRLGITQPRLNDMLRGRYEKFSTDALLKMACRAGLQVHVTVKEPEAA
ncbi:helix-turn-helix domain-containing protein [Tepidicaulis sp. LMO-SS28]|uniref:helix-turn-helix domain-containing protein n=1 Tax=Tepidicaulis sp. LMO-SS28 TaxID=3447455 RepID=UPI003EE3A2DF